MKKVLIFAGSNSSKSINQQLAEYAGSLLTGVETTVIELKDFPAPVFSEDIEKEMGYPDKMNELNELFKAHDGFIVSLPEYNSSITPVLKNTIDWISRIERPTFKDKPVLLLSTSNGARGAITVLEYVESLMPRWGGKVIATFSLANFNTNMNENRTEIDDLGERERLIERIAQFTSSL